MKTRLLTLSFALFLFFCNVNHAQCESTPADHTCVPDDQFEAYLESVGLGDDIANNNYVLTSRIEVVVDLNVSGKGIKSMQGIEDFTALEILNCSSNTLLPSLNVFENRAIQELIIFNCDITSLTLPDSNTLTYLSCSNNNLPGLNVSAYTMLETLHCANNGNQDLGNLDFTNNINLVNLQVHNSGVTSLNISSCTNLDYLTCFNNYSSVNQNSISHLDISSNVALTHLRCFNSSINTFTTGSNPYNSLTYLDCGDNNINSLDATKFPNIQTLWCYYNNLSGLDLSNNMALKSLDCGGNPLFTNIDLSMLPNLEEFWGYENDFTSISASANSKLVIFNSNSNSNLTSVNLPLNNLLLEEVYVCCSNLSSLNFATNTGIKYLDVGINHFTQLDVSMLGSLVGLWCNQNQLTYLNIANGDIDGLITMQAQNNNLDCIQVDDVGKATGKSQPDWLRDFGADFMLSCPQLSTDGFIMNDVVLYPNPSTNTLFIELNFDVDHHVINLQGREILKGQLFSGLNQMDVSSIAKGIYLLELKTSEGSAVKKLIKN